MAISRLPSISPPTGFLRFDNPRLLFLKGWRCARGRCWFGGSLRGLVGGVWSVLRTLGRGLLRTTPRRRFRGHSLGVVSCCCEEGGGGVGRVVDGRHIDIFGCWGSGIDDWTRSSNLACRLAPGLSQIEQVAPEWDLGNGRLPRNVSCVVDRGARRRAWEVLNGRGIVVTGSGVFWGRRSP
jgi:hypothetical protein